MRSHTTLFGMVLIALGGVAPVEGRAEPSTDEAPQAHSARVAALILSADSSSVVRIDGIEWRKAPAKLQGTTGRAGSRIVLDGELWLRADDPLFGQRGPDAVKPPALQPIVQPEPVPQAERSVVPPPETAASIRARQQILLAEARARRFDARGRRIDREAARAAKASRAAQAMRADQADRADRASRSVEQATLLPLSDPAARALQLAEAEARGVPVAEPTLQAARPEPAARPELDALRARQQILLADARARRDAIDSATALEQSTPIDPSRPLSRRRQIAEAPARDAAAARNDTLALGSRAADSVKDRELAEVSASDAAAARAAASQTASSDRAGGVDPAQPVSVSALQLPYPVTRSADRFAYLQLMPLSYDIGGAGVMVEGSGEVRKHVRVIARAAIADRYSEALIGAGLHFTPSTADRLTLMLDAGYEYGVFPLENANTGLQVDDASGGPFVNAGGRLVLNRRFVLEGGVGYSSFHEGDPIAFGTGFFHVNEVVDLMSRIELGDQDSYGIGVRVHY